MSLLSIVASGKPGTEGNVLWGVVSIIEVFKTDDERKLGVSFTGEWFWFPSMYVWYTRDPLWGKKLQGDWQSFFDINQFNLFIKKRYSMRIEGFPRRSHTFYTKGPGTIFRGDGPEMPCTWRLEVSMPEGVPFVR